MKNFITNFLDESLNYTNEILYEKLKFRNARLISRINLIIYLIFGFFYIFKHNIFCFVIGLTLLYLGRYYVKYIIEKNILQEREQKMKAWRKDEQKK